MKGFELRADGFYYAPPIDPDEELDYKLDLTNVLDASDTISNVTWAKDANNLTIVTAKNTNTDKTATVWLKSAVINTTTLITGHITTTGGRTFDRSFKIECKAL